MSENYKKAIVEALEKATVRNNTRANLLEKALAVVNAWLSELLISPEMVSAFPHVGDRAVREYGSQQKHYASMKIFRNFDAESQFSEKMYIAEINFYESAIWDHTPLQWKDVIVMDIHQMDRRNERPLLFRAYFTERLEERRKSDQMCFMHIHPEMDFSREGPLKNLLLEELDGKFAHLTVPALLNDTRKAEFAKQRYQDTHEALSTKSRIAGHMYYECLRKLDADTFSAIILQATKNAIEDKFSPVS